MRAMLSIFLAIFLFFDTRPELVTSVTSSACCAGDDEGNGADTSSLPAAARAHARRVPCRLCGRFVWASFGDARRWGGGLK
jgi:hypothetical protein